MFGDDLTPWEMLQKKSIYFFANNSATIEHFFNRFFAFDRTSGDAKNGAKNSPKIFIWVG